MMMKTYLDPRKVKSYRMVRPKDTHFKEATCNDVDCPHYNFGWFTTVPIGSPQEHYIRNQSGRQFTASSEDGLNVTFVFPAGQKCFQQHRVPLERPAISLIMNTQGQYNKVEFPRFVDDFNEQSYKINKARKEG